MTKLTRILVLFLLSYITYSIADDSGGEGALKKLRRRGAEHYNFLQSFLDGTTHEDEEYAVSDLPSDDIELRAGDRMCISGYIMDHLCISKTHFLDNNDSNTLAEPENHSIHCLLEVDECWQSGYVVLSNRKKNGRNCLGVRVDDEGVQLIRDYGFKLGSSAYLPDGSETQFCHDNPWSCCEDCEGDEDAPNRGLRATIRGTVKELGNGSASMSGTPIIGDIEVSEEGCTRLERRRRFLPVCCENENCS